MPWSTLCASAVEAADCQTLAALWDTVESHAEIESLTAPPSHTETNAVLDPIAALTAQVQELQRSLTQRSAPRTSSRAPQTRTMSTNHASRVHPGTAICINCTRSLPCAKEPCPCAHPLNSNTSGPPFRNGNDHRARPRMTAPTQHNGNYDHQPVQHHRQTHRNRLNASAVNKVGFQPTPTTKATPVEQAAAATALRDAGIFCANVNVGPTPGISLVNPRDLLTNNITDANTKQNARISTSNAPMAFDPCSYCPTTPPGHYKPSPVQITPQKSIENIVSLPTTPTDFFNFTDDDFSGVPDELQALLLAPDDPTVCDGDDLNLEWCNASTTPTIQKAPMTSPPAAQITNIPQPTHETCAVYVTDTSNKTVPSTAPQFQKLIRTWTPDRPWRCSEWSEEGLPLMKYLETKQDARVFDHHVNLARHFHFALASDPQHQPTSYPFLSAWLQTPNGQDAMDTPVHTGKNPQLLHVPLISPPAHARSQKRQRTGPEPGPCLWHGKH